MRRWTVAAAIALMLGTVPGVAQTLSANTAAELGRRDARVLAFFREPWMCAPAAIAPTCIRDLDGFAGPTMEREDAQIPNAGPYPFRVLRTAIAEGDLAHASRALSYINSRGYPDLPPLQGAVAAAAQVAGSIRSAGPNPLLRTLSLGSVIAKGVQDQLKAIGLVPPAANVLLTQAGDAPAEAFVHDVDAKYPPAPLIVLPRPGGPHDEIVLGIVMSLLNELVEQPTLARLPETETFVDAAMQSLRTRLPAGADDLALMGLTYGSTDRARQQTAFAAFGRVQTRLLETIGERTPAGRRFELGEVVSQLGYNAAIFRDAKFAGAAVATISQFRTVLEPDDSLLPEVNVVAACGHEDFACQRRASIAFVARAMGTTASVSMNGGRAKSLGFLRSGNARYIPAT